MQGESVSILMFLLEPVNVAVEVAGEFVRLGVTEFGSSMELVKLDHRFREKKS